MHIEGEQPDNDHVVTEIPQSQQHCPVEVVAIGNQENKGGNSPGNAQNSHGRSFSVGDRFFSTTRLMISRIMSVFTIDDLRLTI
jgi:hypothetical protein